jgi:putative DNA primase/helicase
VAALWVIHTHAHDAAFISPRLVALSPTKRCGKSSLFRSLARMARRPLPTSNISPTAMFRVIEAANPTLFCDEMSSIGDPERATEIRGIVNSSHCRADARVIRNVPVADGYEPRAFSTWAPMALAYIKHVDDQIRDRSVIIPMQRKAPDQAVAQMRLDQDQGFSGLARKAARWASDHLDVLRQADPDVPRKLNDRAADNWRCLLAIADQAGGPWPERARTAAVALSTDADDEDTISVEVLRDLKAVFDTLMADRLASEAIVAHLAGMEGRPWAEFGRPASRSPRTNWPGC